MALIVIIAIGESYEIIWWRAARAQTRALRVPAS